MFGCCVGVSRWEAAHPCETVVSRPGRWRIDRDMVHEGVRFRFHPVAFGAMYGDVSTAIALFAVGVHWYVQYRAGSLYDVKGKVWGID